MTAFERWPALGGRAPRSVAVDGVHVGRGSRVLLRPTRRADAGGRPLSGRTAIVASLHEALDGGVRLAVELEDDAGGALGVVADPHAERLLFAAAELRPLDAGVDPAAPQVLVAGLGNVLLGDDGFGVEVVRLLTQRALPCGVRVAGFGIRGRDLARELTGDWDAALLVDAVQRGEPPGSLSVTEVDLRLVDAAGAGALDPHGMEPLGVLALARAMGPLPPRVLLVGCEPSVVCDPVEDEPLMALSGPVQMATRSAVPMVESLLDELLGDGPV